MWSAQVAAGVWSVCVALRDFVWAQDTGNVQGVFLLKEQSHVFGTHACFPLKKVREGD